MSTRPSTNGWVPPVVRVAAVGLAAAGLVVGAGRVGEVSTGTAAPPTAARVAATQSTSYCTGDPFAGGEDETPTVDVAGSVTAQAAPAEVLDGLVEPSDEPGDITVEALTGEPAAPEEGTPRSGPTTRTLDELDEHAVRVQATQERAPGLLAGQSLEAGGKQVRGLAATPCPTATADAWLVAGGGEPGRQERLVLANPGGNSVSVQLDLVGTSGDDAERSVVVPAHGRSVVLLDGIGGTQHPQAVHVTVTGGLVVPTLVDHHRDGLDPAGVEIVPPTAAPARRLVVPGWAGGSARTLVLAAPGERDAVVQVRRLGEGPATSIEVVTVPADEMVEVELPADAALAGWEIESDEPVVAAAATTVQDDRDREDYAWSVATPPAGTLAGAVLPVDADSGLRRLVQVVAPEDAASAELFVQREGEVTTESIDLEARSGTTVQVDGAEAVWLRPTRGRLHGAVVLAAPSSDPRAETTSIPLLPTRVSVRDVPVTQVR